MGTGVDRRTWLRGVPRGRWDGLAAGDGLEVGKGSRSGRARGGEGLEASSRAESHGGAPMPERNPTPQPAAERNPTGAPLQGGIPRTPERNPTDGDTAERNPTHPRAESHAAANSRAESHAGDIEAAGRWLGLQGSAVGFRSCVRCSLLQGEIPCTPERNPTGAPLQGEIPCAPERNPTPQPAAGRNPTHPRAESHGGATAGRNPTHPRAESHGAKRLQGGIALRGDAAGRNPTVPSAAAVKIICLAEPTCPNDSPCQSGSTNETKVACPHLAHSNETKMACPHLAHWACWRRTCSTRSKVSR